MVRKDSAVRLQYETSESKGKNTEGRSSIGTTDTKCTASFMVEQWRMERR